MNEILATIATLCQKLGYSASFEKIPKVGEPVKRKMGKIAKRVIKYKWPGLDINIDAIMAYGGCKTFITEGRSEEAIRSMHSAICNAARKALVGTSYRSVTRRNRLADTITLYISKQGSK